MKRLLPVLLFVVSFFSLSCNNGTEPKTVIVQDTTSHNFVWQTFTFGDGNSSILNDVVIINDSLVYAVGEIYLNDSAAQLDPQPYGVAIWNGKEWNFRRVYAYTQGGFLENIRPIIGVDAFSSTDIWLADGNAFIWDGHDTMLTSYWVSGYPGNPSPVLGPNQGIGKLWGTSDQNLYGGGANGGLAHYNGSSWIKLESGTNTNIDDVWGIINSSNGNETIYCAVSYPFQPGGNEILKITDTNKVDTIQWVGNEVESVWRSNSSPIYACGDGLFKSTASGWSQINLGISAHTNHVRGNGANDVFVVGIFNLLAHYNGSTWQTYFEGESGDYVSVAIKGDMVVAVGETNSSKALIAIGKRN